MKTAQQWLDEAKFKWEDDVDFVVGIQLNVIVSCIAIAEEQRQKILANPADSSWTEHLAEIQTRMRALLAPQDPSPKATEKEYDI